MDMCYLACVYRTPSGYCGSTGGAATCPHRQKTPTNADRIRSMSDEELARFMAHYDSITEVGEQLAYERWLDWLKQEVSE